ncbi:hypothetical protein EAG18_08535 [Pseudoalteromonas sp. J010]|uniref:hypothetical protein n=1 Tax=Pseudoalteromonas sp. J010 TaxID=998465 RepID=UPI000F64B5C3|nr:hypothetical protein [Pseudoalteromonas sp. J010]RRS09157.1 hypothetical protein EAG18_08535 [Pseudoalteromonas sp. J010]
MSDQGAPRLETLLNKQDLQEILHGWGSPTFYAGNTNHQRGEASRYFIHAFTGRMPTPAEIYYGTFVNKVGDLYSDVPHTFYDAYIGWIGMRTDSYTSHPTNKAYYYRAGGDLDISGRIYPEGASISTAHGYISARVPVKAEHDTSMMMSATFSADSQKQWFVGNTAALEAAHDDNRLVHGLKPTWFYISQSEHRQTVTDHEVRDTQNQHIATISTLAHYHSDSSYRTRQGIVYGRFGSIGSGAEIELVVGDNNNIRTVRPVSIKIKSN